MIFKWHNKKCDFELNLNFQRMVLQRVLSENFLGIWFEETPSWNTHINKLMTELPRSVGCLCKLRELISARLKGPIYYANSYSRLLYCTLVWGTTAAANYYKLEQLQKKVLTIFENFSGHPSILPTAPLFIKHNILKASKLYDYKLALHMYKNNLPKDEKKPPPRI